MLECYNATMLWCYKARYNNATMLECYDAVVIVEIA